MSGTGLPPGLSSRRAAARAVLLFEQAWPALWPAAGVAGLFVVLALFDVFTIVPPLLHLLLLAGFALAFLVLLVRGVRTIRRPNAAAADRRLERDSGLAHRPLATLTDRPITDDPFSLALWQAHIARVATSIGRLRLAPPRPGLAARDRRALRVGLGVALVAGFVVAGRDAPSLLSQALSPSWTGVPAAAGTEVQAWVTPPAYTKLPPIFLQPTVPSVTVPAGAKLTISVTGAGAADAQVSLAGADLPLHGLDKTSFQAEHEVRAGALAVHAGSRNVAGWTLTVLADRPPTAAWTDRPGPAMRGAALRLPWRAEDDYGVTSLVAELTLDEPADRPPPPLTVPLRLPPDAPPQAQGVAVEDLSAHPWAGMRVRGRLIAQDALGQRGESAEISFVMPERTFRNPLARVLIELRRALTLHPDAREPVLAMLDQLLLAPQAFAGDVGGFLNLAGIYSVLVRDADQGAVPDAQLRLWQLALRLEDGQLDRASRALEAARREVREAMERATKDPNDANRKALDEKLRALEQAMREKLQAMLEQARRDGTEEQIDPEAMQMDARDLDRMAEEARKAAQEGRMQDAEKQIAELEQFLDQLNDAQQGATAQNSQRSAQQRAEKRQRGQKQASAVQDMITREGGLLDRGQKRAGTGADKPPPAGPEHQADQRVQQALRRALGELMQQFGDLTGEVPQGLSDADTAMRDATRALGEGADQEAGAAQQRAIAALQKGGREMGQTMAQKFGRGQTGVGQSPGEGDDPNGEYGDTERSDGGPGSPRSRAGKPPGRQAGRDPFGRQQGQGSSGADDSADVQVPEERERQRAQAIQEELRRRGADRSRPQEELDYIDRLLRRF